MVSFNNGCAPNYLDLLVLEIFDESRVLCDADREPAGESVSTMSLPEFRMFGFSCPLTQDDQAGERTLAIVRGKVVSWGGSRESYGLADGEAIHGDSGAPMFDRRGRLLGLSVSSLVIPMDEVEGEVNTLDFGLRVTRHFFIPRRIIDAYIADCESGARRAAMKLGAFKRRGRFWGSNNKGASTARKDEASVTPKNNFKVAASDGAGGNKVGGTKIERVELTY